MKEDQVQFLLEQKLSVMNAIGAVTMSWWTTAIVFCLTSIGVAWLYRNRIEKRFLTAGFITVLVVFILLAAYGLLVTSYLGRIKIDIASLANSYGAPANTFDPEIEFFQQAMITANIDFTVLTVVWVVLYIYLIRRPASKISELDTTSEP